VRKEVEINRRSVSGDPEMAPWLSCAACAEVFIGVTTILSTENVSCGRERESESELEREKEERESRER
jgi:hypothetical protein